MGVYSLGRGAERATQVKVNKAGMHAHHHGENLMEQEQQRWECCIRREEKEEDVFLQKRGENKSDVMERNVASANKRW